MTSEEFQKIVLKKLTNLELGQETITKRLDKIETKLDGIEAQAHDLTEFKTVVKEAGESLYKKIV